MNASTLHQLQRGFQDYVLHREPSIQAAVADTSKFEASARLAIYAEAYRLRLLEVLENDYPTLRKFIGADAFAEVGLAYIDACPSQHFSVRYFGKYLPTFLAETAYAQQACMTELAAFEWALGEAFDAADELPITSQDIGDIAPDDWPRMRLKLHPSLRRLDLHWDVTALWHAADQGQAMPEPQNQGVAIPWLIWRQDLRNYFRSLSAHEAWALDAIAKGLCFADLCAGLCRWVSETEAASRALKHLQCWIRDGLLISVTTSVVRL
jgi:hypothetical protein